MTNSQVTDQPLETALSQWVISDQSGEALEPTRLMKTLMMVADDKDTGGVCLILPVSEGVDQLAAITTAIAHMRVDCETMAHSHEQRTFVAGQRVKTLPDGLVYEVAGKVSEKTGGYEVEGYWLQRLDRRKGQDGGRFLIRKTDLQRFEATNRKRPIGREKQTWSPLAPTPLDALANTTTFGNLSLQRNRVITENDKAYFHTEYLVPVGRSCGSVESIDLGDACQCIRLRQVTHLKICNIAYEWLSDAVGTRAK